MTFNGTGRLRLRHFKVLIRPSLITFVILLIWAELEQLGIIQPMHDSDETTNSLLPLLGTFHAIVAGFLIIRVMEEDGLLHECVEKGDVKRLRRELRKRIHPLVHVLLALFTFLIITATVTLPYQSGWTGILHVGGTSLALITYWEVAVALDNPFSTPWVRDVIPDSMEAELLKLDEEERKRKAAAQTTGGTSR